MAYILQLFELMITMLCFDFAKSFQTSILGTDKYLTEEHRSLIGEPEFGYNELKLTWCQKKNPLYVSLDLSNFGITRLPPSFISSQHVTCLDLQNNNFQETVEFNIFKNLPDLEYLNLARNNLNLQKLLNITSHPKIKTLILDNADNYKGTEFYRVFDSLRVLHLHLPSLEKLSLRRLNPGSDSYFEFSGFDLSLTKLTHLFLSDNKIREISYQFFNNLPVNLTHLFLERCNLNLYSASSSKVTSLILLSMDGNSFSCSSYSCLHFEGHPELQYLSLANCNISVISPNIFDSNKKLVYLDLSGNKLQQLPEQLFIRTAGLLTLNLNNNHLKKVPNLIDAIKLRKLYLNGNRITNLDENSFNTSKNLQILSFSGNNIDYTNDNYFRNLLDLIVLDFSDNQLKRFVYSASANLDYLILRNNLISSINYIELHSKTSLEFFDLRDNPLEFLDPKSMKYVSENKTIVLQRPTL